MQLHVVVGSPNARKVQTVVNLLGLTVELVYHDFFRGDLRTPAFRSLNPNGLVPVLVDGDFVLWESNAIMQYLADRAGGDPWFPREPRRRADVVRWQCWELAHFNKALGILAKETVAKPAFGLGAANPSLVEAATSDFESSAPILETHMAGRRWAVGDDLTLADISLMHLENFMPMLKLDWAAYPNLLAYAQRLREVAAWARTAPPSMEAIGRIPKAA